MELTKEMMELIIAKQCYNPSSYNGWTGESGCSFRYPIYFCKNKTKLQKREITKESGRIEGIYPECVNTMKYKFGANHLYIGDGLVEILNLLEERYGVDFNELEKQVLEKKRFELSEKNKILENGQSIFFEPGRYVVGIDLPVGTFGFSAGTTSSYSRFYIKNTRGNTTYYSLLGDERKK